MSIARTFSLVLIGLFLSVSLAYTESPAELKKMSNDAKAAIRAYENTTDPAVKKEKVILARDLIEKIKKADPAYSELRILQMKLAPKVKEQGLDEKAGKHASAGPASNNPEKERALSDWKTIVEAAEALKQKSAKYFTGPTAISYDESMTDDVIKTASDILKNEKPKLAALMKEMVQKYGEGDAMDKKIVALTPKDPSKGMYDEANKRPDEMPARAFQIVNDIISKVENNMKAEAKQILSQTMMNLTNMSFYQDDKRKQVFDKAETELKRALKFNPEDEEVKQALVSLKQQKTKSDADTQKALESARFPSPGAFSGPGNINALKEEIRKYYVNAYPKEKPLAITISGNWFATKHDLLMRPIQWGLPVYVAAQQNEKDVCRVFKMTVLTVIRGGVPQAAPLGDHWTGDSYRMLIKNLKQ
ncbi:MAG: hypothetical protein MUC76_05330 [Spirochaetes bacterium]|nr:hypothetical protein [Spirochaetota bacterium]